MNKQRRADLDKAVKLLDQVKEIVETAATDECDGFDSLPECFQTSSDRGQEMEQAADALDSALESLGEAADQISEATGG